MTVGRNPQQLNTIAVCIKILWTRYNCICEAEDQAGVDWPRHIDRAAITGTLAVAFAGAFHAACSQGRIEKALVCPHQAALYNKTSTEGDSYMTYWALSVMMTKLTKDLSQPFHPRIMICKCLGPVQIRQ